ncbi:MAG: anthranilate phosphoribosyltransferase [Neisseriaceae bacterium]
MLTPVEVLNRLLAHNEIFYDEMKDLMRLMMQGEIPQEMIAALLTGLRMKVETVSEISAALEALKEFSNPVPVEDSRQLLDVSGSGGDGLKTFNISTTSMFVLASLGVKVAKHGGNEVSSSSGSATIMESMGANIYLTPRQIVESIEQCNIGFMFAPLHHPVLRHVAPVRKILGIRTIFNILAPLLNPAGAQNQLLGVFHPDLLGICANVGKQQGLRRLMVVHGCDGMDEITLSGTTQIAELSEGQITYYSIHPEEFKLPVQKDLKSLQVQSSIESLKKMDSVLDGEKGPCRDIVLLNSAAALYCVGIASTIQQGIEMAQEAIDSKSAQAKKAEFIAFTHLFDRQAND